MASRVGKPKNSHHQELIHQVNKGGKQLEIISAPSWTCACNSHSQGQDWAKGSQKTVSVGVVMLKHRNTQLWGAIPLKCKWSLIPWCESGHVMELPSCCSNMLSSFLLATLYSDISPAWTKSELSSGPEQRTHSARVTFGSFSHF